MSLQPAWQLSLGFLDNLPIVVEPGQDQLTSDGGLLPIRQFDEQLGLTGRFIAELDDPRQSPVHTFAEMTRSRIYGILAGYANQNDHDELRFDPIFKLVAVEAMNILARLRRHVADPPPEKAAAELPHEALAGRDHQRFFNKRRERDPLGERHACRRIV